MITVLKEDDGEICVYSTGRQMVLPPSIHPNGLPYKWRTPIETAEDLPVIDFEAYVDESNEKSPVVIKRLKSDKEPFTFEVKKIDTGYLPVSDDILSGIVSGEGIVDRSAFLLNATVALHSAGLSKDEILNVLTDPENFISSCAREHRKTSNRHSQAQWLWEYTVKKVMTERDASLVFKPVSELPPEEKLTGEALKAQTEEFLSERNWRHELKRSGQNGGGPPVGNVSNVVKVLTNAVGPMIVRRNEFAFRDTYGITTPWGGAPDKLLSDDEVVKIKYWLGQNFNFEPKSQVIEESLIIIACQNAYDPVKDWLNGLPKWDETPRLATWLRENFQAKGDSEYLNQVFSKWLMAMVARAFRPGIKFDWMPIYEGKQGVGKSSFGRLLVGDEFFLDWLPNLTDKDSALALQGQWSVEMGELANMRRAQLEDVKSYITRTTDKIRPPYGRRTVEAARRCVFFGTTNRETYLIDDTGNRRFKPVEVGNLNFKALKRDRPQLFAEAKWLFESQELNEHTFELTGQAKIFEAKIHQEKMVEDEATVMREAMKKFIEKVEKKEATFNFKEFRILDLFSGAGPLGAWRADNRNCQFAAKMLKKFNGQKRKVNGFYFWNIEKGAGSEIDPCPLDFY